MQLIIDKGNTFWKIAVFDEDTIKGLKNENIILKYNFYLNEKFIDEMKKKWDEEDEAEKTPGEVKEVVEGN